jgi:hypothetical protein
VRLLVLAVLLLTGAAAAGAQTTVTGQTASGAFYHVQVPAGWSPSDGLVIWNHGFTLDPPQAMPDLGPLAAVQLAEGYAVAASSYSLAGWALFQTGDDLSQMVAAFETAFGVPDEVLVYGASLGGIVTARAIEDGGLGNVTGAYTMCGAVAGSRLWDGGLDLRLLYDFVCDGVFGAAIPGGAGGLPCDSDFSQLALALAVNACTGILTPGGSSGAQQARLGTLLAVTGLPAEFVLTDMGFATFALRDLVCDPAKLDGGLAMDNAGVVYGDAAVDAGIERVTSDPAARFHLLDNFTPAGAVGAVKSVAVHTDKDGLVIVENQNEYASVVAAASLTVAIVVEDTPTHCDFSEAEALAGWEALRDWLGGAPQPTATSIGDACETLVGQGTAAGPCRFDPGFEVPDLDQRIRPRGPVFFDGFESGDTSAWE